MLSTGYCEKVSDDHEYRPGTKWSSMLESSVIQSLISSLNHEAIVLTIRLTPLPTTSSSPVYCRLSVALESLS